ncbi:cytochrome C oxidase assembly factor 3b [Festucalex cinctus]
MAEGDSAKQTLSAAEERVLRRRQELNYWKKNASRIRRRNLVTSLCMGAFVVGMFGYSILFVKQERNRDEIDGEARSHIIRGARTGGNS